LSSILTNQKYQNTQAPIEKTEKTDRFAYLQNFFPQNHITHPTPYHIDKSLVNTQKTV
jgi:hypothetical protein